MEPSKHHLQDQSQTSTWAPLTKALLDENCHVFFSCGASSAKLPKSSLPSVFWPLKVQINLHALLFYEILRSNSTVKINHGTKKTVPFIKIRLRHKNRHKKACLGVQEGGLSRRPLLPSGRRQYCPHGYCTLHLPLHSASPSPPRPLLP